MTGQGVLVTGAAAGIGRATALLCHARGAGVVALDVDADGLSSLVAEAGGSRIVALTCDVAEEDEVFSAFAAGERAIGAITGVVANAGIERNAELHALPADHWDHVLDVNLRGAYLTCKAAVQSMLARDGGGSIVCVSSPAAFVGFAGGGNAAYAASKGGLSSLVRSAAVDYAARGIRINAVVPGATDTAMLLVDTPAPARAERHRDLQHRAAAEIPMQRMAQPVEIARAVAWLLSDEAGYVTGSHLIVDGGLLAKSANTF